MLVPLLVSNGHVEVRGATNMGTPTLPLAIVTSHELDLCKVADVAMADQLRAKTKAQMARTANLLLANQKHVKQFVTKAPAFPRTVPRFRAGFLSKDVWAKWGLV